MSADETEERQGGACSMKLLSSHLQPDTAHCYQSLATEKCEQARKVSGKLL